MKKTVPVLHILQRANTALNSDHIPQEVKRGISSLLETILVDTGNYRGFIHTEPRAKGFEEKPWDPIEDGKTQYTRSYSINPALKDNIS